MFFASRSSVLCRSLSTSTEINAHVYRSIVQQRKTCARFKPNCAIDPMILNDILETTIRSPSSFNIQPTQIILVQDEAIKQEIASVAMIGKGNQYRTRDCSVLAVFCSDLQPSLRIKRILELEQLHMAESQAQGRHPDYLATMSISTSFMLGEGHLATWLKQTTLDFISSTTSKAMPEIDPIRTWAYKNTSLMVQTYVLASTSHNLETSIMEGFDPRLLKDILRIPEDRYGIPMVVATGYEYTDSNSAEEDKPSRSPQTARLSVDEVVFHNSFGAPIHFEKRNKDL